MLTLGTRVKQATTVLAMLFLVACTETPETVSRAPEPLGDFKLGFVTVFADNVERGPLSREASTEELEINLKAEMERKFTQYSGSKFYNLAISVETYILAVPGIPLVASPKSALVLSLNVWDDAKGVRISEEHKQFTVLEKISGETFLLGSGLTQSKEQQLAGLTNSAVIQIEKWLQENKSMFETSAAETTDG